jgi:hypothetical protein
MARGYFRDLILAGAVQWDESRPSEGRRQGMSWHLELEKVVARWSGGDYIFAAFADEDRPPQHIVPLEMGSKLRVGRQSDCEIRVPDPTVARQHFLVWRNEAGVWVRDLGSPGGTFLHGRRIASNRAVRLDLDDVVHVANFAMVLTARFEVPPGWRDFHNGLLMHLARGITSERRVEDLPILADVLEDAGCDLGELLGHLRQPHPREQRCWVVKRLLRGLSAGAAAEKAAGRVENS